MDNWIDKEYIKQYKKIVGVDEAGRGPLAGPVVAAAVFLTEDQEKDLLLHIPFLNDSKKLSEKKRNIIWKYVKNNRIYHAIGLSDVEMIDEHNILVSTNNAMNIALSKLKTQHNMAIVDGKSLSLNFPNIQIVNGDSRSIRIALASNIAKVVRDKIMHGFSKKYPGYIFEKNKGYGTKAHIKALEIYGPTPFHRLTFKPIIEKIRENTLLHWLRSGQIRRERFEMILTKTKSEQHLNRQLIGFIDN